MSDFEYEWDAAKAARNLAIHGVDFADVEDFEWECALTIDQIRSGELRHLSYAPVGGRLHALVWTDRDGVIRIISFRKANSREVLAYEKAIEAGGG